MKNRIIKTAAAVSIMAAAGIFFIKSGEGQDISKLREEIYSESVGTAETAEHLEPRQLPVQELSSDGAETETVSDAAASGLSADGSGSVYADAASVQHPDESEDQEADSDGRININTASAEDLKKLKGIGDAKAQRIIEYRQSHGGFASPEEITRVKGIGEATFEKNRDLIKIK